MTQPALQIGAFELQEILGRGGMGEVWLALHTTEWLPVAIKLVTLEHATHARFRSALKREAESLAQIHHAHIASLLSQGELTRSVGAFEAGTPYIITEYVEGFGMESLGGALPHEVIRRLLLELLDALAHVHAHGIVHRDIKPENVLVQGTPARPRHVKLVDFGIAHLNSPILPTKSESSNSFKGLTGTPAYMAPELILNHVSDVGPWTDLYAVGCLAWQLLTGAPPFTGTNFSVIQAQLYSQPGEFVASSPCPPGIKEWLHRLLHKNPARRFERAADAARALLMLPIPAAPLSWRGREDSESGAGEHSEHTLVIPELKRALWRDAVTHNALPTPHHTHTLPATWHRPRPPRQPQRMLGADISLWGIRELPMIGHDRARTMLWEMVHEVATAKRAHGVLLEGPAGCGKSRLGRWLMVRAHEVGAVEVLQWSHHQGSASQDALGTMLRNHLKLHHTSRPILIERLRTIYASLPLPDWAIAQDPTLMARILSPAPQNPIEDARITQSFETPTARYEVIARFLRALARKRPVLMVLDDVQWGHDAISFVEHILDSPQLTCPILFVMMTRTRAAPSMSTIAAHPLVHTIALDPLTPEHMRELLEELLISDEQLLDQILAYSQGIPLFAIGLIQDWIDQRKLIPSREGFALAANDHMLALPEHPEQLWTQRIDMLIGTLDDTCAHTQALWLAAALGRRVEQQLWHKLCIGMELGDPTELRDALCARDMAIDEVITSSWYFASSMLHEALRAQAVAHNQWPRINLRCADAMRALVEAGRVEMLDRVARHYMEAEAHEEAIVLWAKHLEHALTHRQFLAIDEALTAWQHCNTALHYHEDHPMVWRHMLWSTFASAIRGDTKPETAESALRDLQHELESDSLEHAIASDCMARLSVLRGDDDAALKHLRAAASRYRALDATDRLNGVEFELMRLLARRHQHSEARQIGQRLLTRATSERRALHTHITLAELSLHLGPDTPLPPPHEVLLEQLMPRVLALDEPLSAAKLWTVCGDIAAQDDQLDDAARYYTHAHELLLLEQDELADLEVQLKLAMTQLAGQQWVNADLDIQQITRDILARDDAQPLHAPLYAAQITAHLKRHDIHSAQTALARCAPELSKPGHHPRAQYHIAQALLHAAEVAIGLDLRQFARSLLAIARLQWASLGSVMHTRVIDQITQEMG